jgi:heat shock protein HslJ
MKKSGFLMTVLACCTMFWGCNADRKPARTPAPAVAVTAAAAAGAKADTFNLVGSEWVLEDLAGSGVVNNVRATLSFPEADQVAGNGSCNRFFGPAQIAGTSIKLGPLGSTRIHTHGVSAGSYGAGDKISERTADRRTLRVEGSLTC